MKRSPMPPRSKPMSRGASTLKRTAMAHSVALIGEPTVTVPKLKPAPKKRRRNAPTKHESAYMGAVAALGCALCRRLGYGPTPAEVHHPRRGTGAGQRSSHYDVIPLCPPHHRGNEGIHGMGVKAWMAHYGISEAELTKETQTLLAAYLPAQTTGEKDDK